MLRVNVNLLLHANKVLRLAYLAAADYQHFLVAHLPSEDQRPTAFNFGEFLAHGRSVVDVQTYSSRLNRWNRTNGLRCM